ncbi:MAG TPA: nucleotide exchange factor GrpE [Candidatus Syntrophosphaera sp.]|jgi:molecular chaperone GrpE|nr:nucleotide exchange factor GrpE [Candidatus Syntrophosphaera sp.]
MKKKTEKLTEDMEKRAYEEESEELQESSIEAGKAGREEELRLKIDGLEKDCAEWKDKYLRSMAEFENFRRRSNEEKSDWIKLATQKLALEVCDVADNFERALLQVEPAKLEEGFFKGVLMIEKQLRSVLEKEGVQKIEALGKEFDPALHDALAHIPSEYDENTVAAIIQNGYTMHGKILRPVRVAVSSGKIEDNNEEPQGQPETDEISKGGNGSDIIEIKVQ